MKLLKKFNLLYCKLSFNLIVLRNYLEINKKNSVIKIIISKIIKYYWKIFLKKNFLKSNFIINKFKENN